MKETSKRVSLTDVARRIDAHLKRFEADPKINAIDASGGMRTRPYYYAGAGRSGRYVSVSYVTYQGETCLTRDEAEKYLAKLDAGFVGRHWEALRSESWQ